MHFHLAGSRAPADAALLPLRCASQVSCQPGPGQSLEEAFLQGAVRAANEDIWCGGEEAALLLWHSDGGLNSFTVQAALPAHNCLPGL